FTVTYSTIDDTVVDSASPETLPLSIGGVSATGGILDNDKPSISPARTSSVSEEGLAGGITDTTGTTDTTNAVTNSGSFTVVNAASVTLSLPQGTYTSGGSPISWALSNNNHTLTGSVGGKPVMTVVINDTGGYTTTLLKPIDHPVTTAEDVRTIPITVTAANGSDTSTSTLSISVEDDAPTAANTTTSITLPNVDTNIQLILDRSSSMGDVVSGTTRFKLMKDSVNELLKAYDNLGNVRVNIVQFDANSSQLGNGWVDVATAKNLVNAMTLGNGTNYDAGINTARTAFATGGKISGAQNVTYFFSDGEPMGDGIAGNEITTWTDFLNANQINSFAYGVGTGANRTSLDPIAYNGIDHVDTLGVVVADATQLPPVLRDSSVTPTTGNLVSGSLAGSASFGADGGYLNTITIEGTTYTYDPKALNGAGQVTKVGTGKGVFDTANNTLTVTTNKDGKLVINLDTGDYSYTADPTITSTHQEVIGFSVIDRDGDGASATLRIDVNPPAQANVVTLTSSVGATLPGTGLAGEYYGYNDNRTGVASDATTKFSGVTRIHADDGNVATATLTQAATPNLSNLAEVEKIVEGRSADTSLVGSARVAPANAADAAFTIKTLEFGVASSVEVPTGANVTFNNDLGQSDVKFTTGQIVTSGAADKMNNLARFLQGNTSSIVATGGVGDTTDAAIRAVGYVNIPITGKYDFRIAGDDGYRLLINGVNLTEVDEIQAPAIATFANKTLSAGIQPIEILYWDQAGHAVLRIEVKPSGAPDAAYEVLGTKSYALFAPGSQPTGLTENQDLVETSDGVWAVRTGGVHTSNVSSQQVIGSEGNDSISTGADSDVLTGGGGNDRLTGGAGSDTFVWQLGDQGTRSHPAQDSISDFNNASQTNGGDVLNLADLLQSENHNTGIGNLGDYLHFAKSGADTIMEAKHTGAGAVTQRIVLEGLDLTQNGSLTDSAIIADLLNKGKLITD
ncbi:MAG: type I secretion C-terminal target domain-containing protein, partial [Rhodoferax sp.]|nr:type I secretion C-terminal target domain-containing protein [Rhodoferax sp.]